MNRIIEKSKTFVALIGKQAVELDKKYRKFDFCIYRVIDGENVLYNSLTGDMVVISQEEAEIFKEEEFYPTSAVYDLIGDWFAVPVEHDDISFCEEYRMFMNALSATKGYSCFTVMTTTDCNARCFYCYEMGRARIPMSEKTALDVAEYIINNCDKTKKVFFYWYGGEPLYNKEVIDVICGKLQEADISYESFILTNGYLFDDDTVVKAIGFWNLQKVQIAMDGTEEIYNRSKAYIYNDGKSPYRVVMDNVERLLKNGVKVIIRLNMDKHNQNDLEKLADIYVERFGKYDNFYVYPALIFELEGAERANHSSEDRMELAKRYMEFWDYCVKIGILNENGLGKHMRQTNCIADTESAIMITPDGHLGKCDHYSDKNFVGDIYHGITDKEMVDLQSERANSHELCKGCPAYPKCIKLKKCPAEGFYVCDESKRYITCEKLYRSIDAAYRKNVKQILN